MAESGKFECTVSEDRNTARLSIQGADGCTATLEANGFDLLKIIRILAGARDQMLPEFPKTLGDSFALNESNSFGVVRDPGWRIPGAPMDGCRVLAVLMPGLGWIAMQFPQNVADDIATWLKADGKDPFANTAGRA